MIERLLIRLSVESRDETRQDQRSDNRQVSMIVRRRVKPGCQVEFEATLRAFVRFSVSSPGHLDIHVLTRRQDGHEDCVVANRLVDAGARGKFTGAPEFRLWLQRLAALTNEIPETNNAQHGDSGHDSATSVSTDPKRMGGQIAGAVIFFGIFGLTFSLPALVYFLFASWHPIARDIAAAGLLLAILIWITVSYCDRHAGPAANDGVTLTS